MNRFRITISFISFTFLCNNFFAQISLRFNSLDSLLKYAENSSSAIRSGQQQSLLAKWTKIASGGNIINFRSPFSASWTDNTQLPISYIPAEALGGPAGMLKQVSLGQQFVTSYSITPQIDIINPSAWARLRSAELNKQLTEINNLITKKNLFESIAATYFSIVSYQDQKVKLEKSVAAADTVMMIAKNKFSNGIIREQDFNNATANFLNVQDKLFQLNTGLEQNFNNLKILCELQPESTIQINETVQSVYDQMPAAAHSSLNDKQANMQESYMKSELNASRLSSYSPTLSLLFNQTWQLNSNISFTDQKSYKFNSQYIGIRLSIPFPFEVNRMTSSYTSKINYNISAINKSHGILQSKINDKQLDLDYLKANSSYKTAKQVAELKDINYQKSLNQYREGIISTDILLTAFTDMINAGINYSGAFASMKFSESKIKINNTVQ